MNERTGDLVLPQGTYVLLQDAASGQVEVVTGPHKVSLADTDKPVIYNGFTRKFDNVAHKEQAIKVCASANEGQYIVLTNPSTEKDGRSHPTKGKQGTVALNSGRKINIQGPDIFALFPAQIAEVIDGHQLKSNEYLLIRVYNEIAAKENLKNAVVKTTEKEDKNAKNLIDEKEIRTGNLLIIKGTDVSFYIPPTGIEVLSENGNYVRKAVTLERLEYCVLLDQNGDKRYVEGPAVVFPKPTETFIEQNGTRMFKAMELNENMGIYIKVIAEYEGEDPDVKKGKRIFKAGEELFITGKEQKIYFPRAEHAIIKYGENSIHYATAVPAGEGRYILDKTSGEVKLLKGPKMLLPDPRTEVIVKRVLDLKTVNLWFPGNTEAIEYNQKLQAELEDSDLDFLEDSITPRSRVFAKKSISASFSAVADEMERKTSYTKPRTIKLDTKYDGAVIMNIWPNYAIQVVNKSGDRKVIEGPAVTMLEYDEGLDVLELSTGKPKNDHDLLRTVYLQTKNNVVSDIIDVETKDLVNAQIKLSYRVNFEGENNKWFNVPNYVKLLTQHMRSLIRNIVKKDTIENFNENAADIIRDGVLGTSEDGKRTGRKFEENGMCIYDMEILDLKIGDDEIDDLLRRNQHDTVRQNLRILQATKKLEDTKTLEDLRRKEMDEIAQTKKKEHELEETKIDQVNALAIKKLQNDKDKQEDLDIIGDANLERKKKHDDQNLSIKQEYSNIRVKEFEKEMAAIQPKLIEALISSNDIQFSAVLAKNLKEQRGGFGGLFEKNKGGWQALLNVIKGSPLERRIMKLASDYDTLYNEKDNENE